MEKAVQLGLRARVGDHAPGLHGDLLAIAQLPFRGGLQELPVGNGIPERQRQPRSHIEVIRLLPLAQIGIEETRRTQGEEHHALHSLVGALCSIKLTLDEQLVLLVGQRTAESRLGKGAAELPELLLTIRRACFRSREFIQIFLHMLGHGDRALGRGLIPRF